MIIVAFMNHIHAVDANCRRPPGCRVPEPHHPRDREGEAGARRPRRPCRQTVDYASDGFAELDYFCYGIQKCRWGFIDGRVSLSIRENYVLSRLGSAGMLRRREGEESIWLVVN